MDQIFSAIVPTATNADRQIIAGILSELPSGVISTLADARCTIRPLAKGERYADVSPALRRLGIDVDNWSVPPAGLVVVEERAMYLRSRSRMTVAHECGHLLDLSLGGGIYRSGTDLEFRELFRNATRFVTPYAASGHDEAFAEAFRSIAGDFNDVTSHWPKTSPERLRRVDPSTYAYMQRILAEIAERDTGAQLEFVLC